MQVQRIQNNITFGNARGGIKNLKIIKNKEGLQLLETSKTNSDVSVFVAGGSKIDKKVRNANINAMNPETSVFVAGGSRIDKKVEDANINAMKKLTNKNNETKQKSGIRSFFLNLIRA